MNAATENLSVTQATEVYRKLRRDIVRGKLMPGEKLRVEAIRARYRAGATPTREALNRLASEGLVVLEDQKGFSVAPISASELVELTNTRRWVNEIAFREAIVAGDEVWEEGILLAHHRLSRTPMKLPDEPELHNPAWDQRHQEFHAALISSCPSQRLLEFADALFEAAFRYQGLSTVLSTSRRDTHEEHRSIMNAVLARDTQLAIKLANEHIALTAEIVMSDGLSTRNGA